MNFRKDSSLLCEYCGHAVLHCLDSDGTNRQFVCSNPDCSNGKTPTVVLEGDLPEWVVVKDLNLSREMNDAHIEF